VRYWWVNHNKTARQELGSGYLWSPKREANGARSQFYNNMRIAAPSDLVFSFVHGHIGHVGLIEDFAFGAAKPAEFGDTGSYWSTEGWQLPVKWQRLPKPVRPKPLIDELRPWLPAKYSPIHPQSGNGSEKAYLCEIRKEVFDFVMQQGGATGHFVTGTDATIAAAWTVSDQRMPLEGALGATERDYVGKARRGQDIFRFNVCQIESRCRLTGIANPTLLTASHIKPWRSCTTTFERLDGSNGLLLAPHVDRLFDRGLISFEKDGAVLLSPRFSTEDIRLLGLDGACGRNAGTFRESQERYLAHHRSEVFLR
jgi:putative restriction endonuclease